jgi:pimeloyl-ACP methyl ester carboxylesterase
MVLLGLLVLGPEGGPFGPTAELTGDRVGLTDLRPCPEVTGFTCGQLTVPVDRQGRLPGTLRLRVATADNANAPRGALLFLTGGPGQPGVGLLPRIIQRIGYLLADYRLVMIDQRGTGAGALDCPRLQAEVGASDLRPPSPVTVRECADLLGEARPSYPTTATVADLEALRIALDLPHWTLDGVSYGSFVATRYALTYPRRVARLVLDSVVPQPGVPALSTATLRHAGTVLRQACREQHCGYDLAADLAAVVRRYGTGVRLLDLLATASIVEPALTGQRFPPVLTLLHRAAQGDPGPLDRALAALRDTPSPPAAEFSAGLHAATLCADLAELPWGDPSAPLAGREMAVRQAVQRLSTDDVWPFDPATAGAQGLVETTEWQGICMIGPEIITRRQTRAALADQLSWKLGITAAKPDRVLEPS